MIIEKFNKKVSTVIESRGEYRGIMEDGREFIIHECNIDDYPYEGYIIGEDDVSVCGETPCIVYWGLI